MQPLPAIISKHWIGYVAILGIGIGLAALLWFLIYDLYPDGLLTLEGATALLFASAVILAITIIQVWVYSLSYVELTEQGIHVVNWRTLFVKQDVTTEWVRVQDAAVGTSSIFSLLFGYGRLTVQTAGTDQTLFMTMVPQPEYWRDVIQRLADAATDPQS